MLRRIPWLLLLLMLGSLAALSATGAKRLPPGTRTGRDGGGIALPASPPAPRSTASLDEVVLSEDFEHTALGSLPSGWSQNDQDGGYCSWFQGNSVWQSFSRVGFDAHGGSRVAMCPYNDNELPNDDWLILPVVNLSGTISFGFWAASQDTHYRESFELRVSTTGHLPPDFTELVLADSAVPVPWTFYSADLSAFAGAPFYIALRYNSANRFLLKIDDVTLSGTPPPSGLISGVVTGYETDPVDNATVQILSLGRSQRTDTLGRFRFSLVPPGSYTLRVSHPYYYTHAFSDVTVTAAETTLVDAPLELRTLRFFDWTSTNTPRQITDFDTVVMAIFATDTAIISDLDVTLNLVHSYVGDLSVWIETPDHIRVQLVAGDPYRAGRDILGARFDDDAEQPFSGGVAPYTGHWRPAYPLSQLNGDTTVTYSLHSAGTRWQLFVYDGAQQDIGVLYSFQMHVVEDTLPSALPEPPVPVPAAFRFMGNYPNPFNGETRFRFELPQSGPVQLTLYNVLAQPVAEIWRGRLERGAHDLPFSAAGLPSGLYFARLSTPDQSLTRKMLLIR